MSHIQWVFEGLALRKKEREERKERMQLVSSVFNESIKAFREIVISLLGLNVGAGTRDEGELSPYIPLINYVAKPELLKAMLDSDAKAEASKSALKDESLDELNKNFMEDFDAGDLEPIFSGILSEDPFERWSSPEHQQDLMNAGVEVLEDGEELEDVFGEVKREG